MIMIMVQKILHRQIVLTKTQKEEFPEILLQTIDDILKKMFTKFKRDGGSPQEIVTMNGKTWVQVWLDNTIVEVGHGLDVGRNRRDENIFANKETDIHD